MVRPKIPISWTTVGTAFDYRLRFYFAPTRARRLIAWQGAVEAVAAHRLSASLCKSFFSSLDTEVRRCRPMQRLLNRRREEMLVRHCYVLALFEQIYRASAEIESPLWLLSNRATPASLLRLAPREAVHDLMKLSYLAHSRWRPLFGNRAVLNPTFDGSVDVDGADADLIVGRCLWDVKTTVKTIERRWLYQLLGYVLLDYSDRHRIREVGFYLTRRSVFQKWSLGDLLRLLSGGTFNEFGLSALRRDFRRSLRTRKASAKNTISERLLRKDSIGPNDVEKLTEEDTQFQSTLRRLKGLKEMDPTLIERMVGRKRAGVALRRLRTR